MKRIHKAYGYSHEIKPEYNTEVRLIQYEEQRPEISSEYDLYDNSEDNYVVPYTEEDEELEEIKEYKYNYVTGVFE
jgi:hypothetical protein